MSTETTLSPSPFTFGSRQPSIAVDDIPQRYEGRRTSHPHNQASRTLLSPEAMSQSGHIHQRPSLEHRTSQTVIDLTDDVFDASLPFPAVRQRPPRLDRSDAQGLGNIIDLTADDDLQITGARTLSPPPLPPNDHRHHGHLHPRLPDREPMFVPEAANLHDIGSGPRSRFVAGFGQLNRHIMGLVGLGPVHRNRLERLQGELALVIGQDPGAPARLDYLNPAFGRAREPEKPPHVPPPAVEEGFTRSPKEADVIICPACDRELVAKKANAEAALVVKKNGKAPNKAELRENPFWVVKECGHVYCNQCFQNRRPKPKTGPSSNFPEIVVTSGTTSKKSRGCAVEGCKSDIGDKKNWVGVFL
ncbi:MAG: hypothetical protein M1818_007290 [Claussenomyces sp. TS43310]|nr:MAG: hypothetical protein M1818_007290 [Claussenomyces sp. TS43310]